MTPQQMKEKTKGIFHLSLTPFSKSGDLDIPALKESIRLVTENKALEGEDVVFLALGTTGEFYAMSEAENKTVIDIVTQEVNGKFPVMIGSGRAGTRNTIEVSKYAQSAGADGLLIVPPYYVMPTTDGVIRHFEDIAASVDIGIAIYNNPAASKLWLPMPVIKRLSKVDNIIGLKENANNPNAFLGMLQNIDPDDMAIFAGLGHFMYQYMCFHGCNGYVSEMLNYAPHLALDLYHAGYSEGSRNRRQDEYILELGIPSCGKVYRHTLRRSCSEGYSCRYALLSGCQQGCRHSVRYAGRLCASPDEQHP